MHHDGPDFQANLMDFYDGHLNWLTKFTGNVGRSDSSIVNTELFVWMNPKLQAFSKQVKFCQYNDIKLAIPIACYIG